MIYRFGRYELDLAQLELRLEGVVQAVEPQVFAILELLIANSSRMVSKEEINERVWGGRIVSEAALSSRIRSARNAIGDDGTAQRLIKTIRHRGFRFVGEVTVSADLAAPTLSIDARPWSGAGPIDAARGCSGPDPVAGTRRLSIAVLPLRMLDDDYRSGLLAEAIAHEVIVELSRLSWLHVIARGSSFQIRGPDVDVCQAGSVLGVRYLLTGSMSVFGRRCRLALELAETGDGAVVWADNIEASLEDLMTLRSDITAKVAATVESRIQSREAQQASALPTENLDAWQAYFRGLWHMYRFNAHDNEVASHLFDQALKSDGRFARALSGLSFTHFQNAFIGFSGNPGRERDLAMAKAQEAFALDPLDPFVSLTMGRAEMLQGNWEAAMPWFDRSTEINPSYALAFYHRALSDAVIGSGDEGPDYAMKAIALSPIDPMLYAMLGARAFSHLAQGDLDAAIDWAERAAISPGAHVHIHAIAYLAQALAGNRDASRNWFDQVRRREPQYTDKLFFQAFPIRDERLRATVKSALKRFD